MLIKRVLLVATFSLVVLPGVAHAVPDYPPSGAVVEVEGDVVVGNVVEVRVRNCTLGELVKTSIDSMPTVDTLCESPIASFAIPDEALGRRPGLTSHQRRLPDDPVILEGTVELPETDEILSFTLDVRGLDVVPVVVAVPSANSTWMAGWPYLLLAVAIAGFAWFVAGRRRQDETP